MTLRGGATCAAAFLSISVVCAADSLPQIKALAITQTRDGYLWIGMPDGLGRYDGSEIVRIAQVGSGAVNALAEDSAGTLWIGTESAGLYRLRNGNVERVASAGRSIHSVAEDRMRSMWIASERGVARLAESDGRLLALPEGAPQHARILCVSGNDVWFGTDGEGLVRYANGAFTALTNKDGLSSDTIPALAAGSDGALWIGTQHGGIDVYANGRLTKPQPAAPIATSSITALAAGRDGAIWIGAEGKGLCRFSGDRLDCDGLDDVRAIFEDREGSIWAGRTGSGLRRLDAGAFAIKTHESGSGPVLRDRDGSIWTGSADGLTHARGSESVRYTVRDGLATTAVSALEQDRTGAVWIGTSGGLSRYSNGTITTIASDGSAGVRALHADASGRLWIGTTSGLRCIAGAQLTRCGDGLLRNASVLAFFEDRDGTMWIGTGRGIVRVRSGAAELYASSPAPVLAIRRDENGNLSFSSADGIYRIEKDGAPPTRLASNKVPPPVVIDGVSESGHDLELRYAALTFIAPEKVRFRTMLEGFDREWVDAGASRVAHYTNVPAGRYVFRVIAANNDGVWNTTGASMPLRIEPYFWQTTWFRILSVVILTGLIAIAHRMRKSKSELEVLATIDPLTHIANRRSLDAALGRMWSDHARRGAPLALVLCDIDFFKRYNDTYGHQSGDRALAAVAQALLAAIDPSTDVVARFGGEEFLIVLPDSTIESAAVTGRAIVDSVRALGIEHRASAAASVVTVSAGAAAGIPADSLRAEDLVRQADDALYRAKAEGRNRCAVAANVRASIAR